METIGIIGYIWGGIYWVIIGYIWGVYIGYVLGLYWGYNELYTLYSIITSAKQDDTGNVCGLLRSLPATSLDYRHLEEAQQVLTGPLNYVESWPFLLFEGVAVRWFIYFAGPAREPHNECFGQLGEKDRKLASHTLTAPKRYAL